MADSSVRTTGELYRGKAKVIYRTEKPSELLVHFTDTATAEDGDKRGTITRKGEINAEISAICFRYLEEHDIPTHYLEDAGRGRLLCRSVEIIQVEVVARNVVAGSLARRLGLEEGRRLKEPVIEFYYKNDELHDPLVNDDHIRVLGLADEVEVAEMAGRAREINGLLYGLLARAGLLLVDFKLEFGRHPEGLLLADEISPDTCRFWDMSSGERLDKDLFRRDLGGETEAYQEVLRRLRALGEGTGGGRD